MLKPFPGLLYDPARVGDAGAATSPPYDVIDAELRSRLAAGSDRNIVEILLPEGGEQRYQEAGERFRAWREEGTLVADPSPRFYLYEMEWEDAGRHVARGVMGGLSVVPLGDRVLPHEETMAGVRADRYAVLEETRANLDPIIALSASPDLRDLLVADGPPRVETTADGVVHRLFDITSEARVRSIAAAVTEHTLSIADGHHRYTTALSYREGLPPGPWDEILAMVAPAEGSGLVVAPYHRFFADAAFDPDAAAGAFVVGPAEGMVPSEAGSLTVVTAGAAYSLTPRPEAVAPLPPPWREASAAVARELLYPLVGWTEDLASYTPDADAAVAAARGGGVALLVAPVTEHAIAEASELGIRFPQKTTFFVPKPRAGLVIRAFDV